MFDYEINTLPPEVKLKAAKEVRDQLEISVSDERTYIIVVAIHKEHSRNVISRISCKKGLPLGGYTYDSQSDTYHIECMDYLHLGFAPCSFIARIRDIKHWETRVPLPESVIKKYLSPLQRKELKNFKTHFNAEDHDIQYIQMIDPN